MAERKLTGKERRRDILDNAARVFALHGLDGASMREIARACKVNEALIYKHFPSKDDLVREVIAGIGRQIDDTLRGVAEDEPNGLAGLRSVLRALLFRPSENLHIYAFLAQGMTTPMRHESVSGLVGSGFAQLNEFLGELVDRGIKDGSLELKPGTDPARCSWCILSRGLAFRIVNALVPEGTSPPSGEEQVVGFLLGCISPVSSTA